MMKKSFLVALLLVAITCEGTINFIYSLDSNYVTKEKQVNVTYSYTLTPDVQTQFPDMFI